MHTDLPTLGAPVMIVGLLTGFLLCFYGTKANKYLIPLRSVLSGGLVMLALVFAVLRMDATLKALHAEQTALALLNLLLSTDLALFGSIALASSSLAGLSLFALSRKGGTVAEILIPIFTALSTALLLFLLLLTIFPLLLSLILAVILGILILVVCLHDFPSYLALEFSLSGALLISYLITRFWYLNFFLFLCLTLLFASLGYLTQRFSQKRGRAKEHSLNV